MFVPPFFFHLLHIGGEYRSLLLRQRKIFEPLVEGSDCQGVWSIVKKPLVVDGTVNKQHGSKVGGGILDDGDWEDWLWRARAMGEMGPGDDVLGTPSGEAICCHNCATWLRNWVISCWDSGSVTRAGSHP